MIWSTFVSELVEVEGPYQLLSYDVKSSSAEKETCQAVIKIAESEISIAGEGSGPIDAFVSALSQSINEPLNVVDYQEYALNEGSNAKAISIIAVNDGESIKHFGVGISPNTTTAAFHSIIAALNRKWRQR